MGSNIKEIHKQIIVGKAVNLFIKHGINNVTMSDIAQDIGVGEATLYRYFGRKQNIVLLGAVTLWESLVDEYLGNSAGMTGIERMESFYFAFLKAYCERKEYYGFIYEFDSLLIQEKMDKDLLLEYDKLLKKLNQMWQEIYDQGVKDKTLYYVDDPKVFYITSTHSLLNLCKKLAKESTSLNTDSEVDARKEIELLIKMILNYIKR